MTISFTLFVGLPFESSTALAYAGWAISGVCVAAAQMFPLPLARSHPARWLLAGTIAAAVGIPAGIALGFIAVMAFPDWATGPSSIVPRALIDLAIGVVPGAIAGGCTGFILGVAQAPAIPANTRLRTSWILSNCAAWLTGGAVFGGLVLLSGASFPLSPATFAEWSVWLVSISLFGALSGGLAGLISLSEYSKLMLLKASPLGPGPQNAA
jgi:hypothetical protein